MWWRQHRTAAPRLFLIELKRAFELVRSQPHLGQPVVGAGSVGVRRVQLRRSRYYVYYEAVEDEGVVNIHAVWHTSRGSTPDV